MTHVPMCEWCGNHEVGTFDGGTDRFCSERCVDESEAAENLADESEAAEQLFDVLKRIGDVAKANGRDPIHAARFQMDRAFENFAWEVENEPEEDV